jgi:hypothetical protein
MLRYTFRACFSIEERSFSIGNKYLALFFFNVAVINYMIDDARAPTRTMSSSRRLSAEMMSA